MFFQIWKYIPIGQRSVGWSHKALNKKIDPISLKKNLRPPCKRRDSLLPLSDSANHICVFRHALALDERRVKFLPEYVRSESTSNNDIEEVWFPGTHSDVYVYTFCSMYHI